MLDKLKKIKNASPVVKASMALLMANLILKGLSLISGPIFTRIMPVSEYGVVSTFSSWESLLSTVITLNLAAGVFNNGMLEFKENRDEFQFSLLTVSGTSTLIFFGIYLLFRNFFNTVLELPDVLIYFMFIYFMFIPAYQYWSGRQRYEFKYKLLSCLIVLITVCSIVFGITLVLLVPDEYKAIAKILSSEIVNIIVGVVFFIYIGIKAKFKCRLSYCIYAIKFNVPLIPHYLSMYVLSSSDRIMITRMVDSASTAIYSIAYTVGMIINIVWQSVEASLSPWIYEKLGSGETKAVRTMTTNIALLFAAMCLFCTLFAPEIIWILAPSSYYSGIYVIPAVAGGVFFTTIYSLYMRIELYYKNTGFAMIATTIAAITNLILNYLLIPKFGFVVAGYTTLFSYFVLYILHYLNVKKRGYSYILNNKGIFLISIAVIILSILITFLYDYMIVRYLLIIASAMFVFCNHKKIIAIIKLK